MISWIAQFYLIVILYRKLQALTIFANWKSIHSFNTCDNSLRQKQNFKTAQKHPQCLNNGLFPLQNLKTPMVASNPLLMDTITLPHLPWYHLIQHPWAPGCLNRSCFYVDLLTKLIFIPYFPFFIKKISMLLLTEKPSQSLHFQNFKLDTQYLQFVNLHVFLCKEFTVLTKHRFLLPGRF